MTAPRIDPAYGSASLVDVLPGVLAALTGAEEPDPLGLVARLDGIRRVAVVLVDGFGWHQLAPVAEAVSARPGWGGAVADVLTGRLGDLLRLTPGFPSTTPTSLVGLGTGVPAGVHGVLGFSVRVPETGRRLNHIHWSGDPDPRVWQPVPTVFERATAAGVAVTVVSRSMFEGSGLTMSAWRGGAYRPADDLPALAAGVLGALDVADGPALVYGYHPDLDHAGHVAGLTSRRWQDEALDVDRLLTLLASGLPGDAAVLVTADHGQLDVPDDHRFDLDMDPRLRDGVALVAGEPRVRYLYIEPGAEADVLDTWRGILGEAAWVAPRDEVVAAGLYGPMVPAHLARVGDVVAIARHDHAVVSSAVEPQEARLVAMHGALTPAEMEIPLIILRG